MNPNVIIKPIFKLGLLSFHLTLHERHLKPLDLEASAISTTLVRIYTKIKEHKNIFFIHFEQGSSCIWGLIASIFSCQSLDLRIPLIFFGLSLPNHLCLKPPDSKNFCIFDNKKNIYLLGKSVLKAVRGKNMGQQRKITFSRRNDGFVQLRIQWW